jgi:uncharacterized protein (TIGR00299 family) protein
MSSLRGLHLHFDAPSGAAGDMTLGALFDLGVPVEAVTEVLRRLPVTGYELTVAKGKRGGLVGTDVKVAIEGGHHVHDHVHDHVRDHAHVHERGLDHGHADAHAHGHAHRHYGDIRAMLDAHLEGRARELARGIFDRIAAAEAKLHGLPVDEVAFHEVGAIDSIVDVVGSAAAIAWLAPSSVSASPPATGSGTVRSAHGVLPVPAPATLEIAAAAGMPIVDGGIARELLTPTGAAILATIVETWGAAPALTVRAVGYGAGDDDLPDRANLLRATVGERLARAAHELVRVEANLDDMNPELCEHVAEKLFAAGAVDVWWTPIAMKKSRPALMLGALAPPDVLDAVARTVLVETTTLGVRFDPVERRVLDRRSVDVGTEYGAISVKLGILDGRVVNVAPEHDSCRAAAARTGAPLKAVYAAALAAYAAGIKSSA